MFVKIEGDIGNQFANSAVEYYSSLKESWDIPLLYGIVGDSHNSPAHLENRFMHRRMLDDDLRPLNESTITLGEFARTENFFSSADGTEKNGKHGIIIRLFEDKKPGNIIYTKISEGLNPEDPGVWFKNKNTSGDHEQYSNQYLYLISEENATIDIKYKEDSEETINYMSIDTNTLYKFEDGWETTSFNFVANTEFEMYSVAFPSVYDWTANT